MVALLAAIAVVAVMLLAGAVLALLATGAAWLALWMLHDPLLAVAVVLLPWAVIEVRRVGRST